MGRLCQLGAGSRGEARRGEAAEWRHGCVNAHSVFCRKYQIMYDTWRFQMKLTSLQPTPLWVVLEIDEVEGPRSPACSLDLA